MNVSELELADAGAWPWQFKAVCLIVAATLAMVGGYWLVLAEQRTELTAAESRGQGLSEAHRIKRERAANLAAIREHGERLSATYATALREMRAKTDLPALIDDIDRAAAANALVIERIDLTAERPADFYVEQPLDIVAVGTYHQFGAFVSAIAALPRVITLHDFEIGPGDVGLRLSLAAKTYRYLSDADGTRVDDSKPRHATTDARSSAYQANVRRSPFAIERAAAEAPLGAPGRRKRPLERFAVDRLQMVGTLGRGGITHALLQDPNGHVHRVSANDTLGLAGGQVTSITGGMLEFIEVVDEGAGGRLMRRGSIELQGARALAEYATEEK